jgi:hypothetical protein
VSVLDHYGHHLSEEPARLLHVKGPEGLELANACRSVSASTPTVSINEAVGDGALLAPIGWRELCSICEVARTIAQENSFINNNNHLNME